MRKRMNVHSTITISFLILFLVATIFIPCSHLGAQDTSDWKTYTNKEYGYELKYPPDLTVRCLEAEAVRFERNGKMYFNIDIVSMIPGTKVDLKENIVSQVWTFCSDVRYGTYSHKELMAMIKWKPIMIGGFEGLQASSSDNECINKGLPFSVVEKNNKHYKFYVSNITYGSVDEYNKIFSTIKFIK